MDKFNMSGKGPLWRPLFGRPYSHATGVCTDYPLFFFYVQDGLFLAPGIVSVHLSSLRQIPGFYPWQSRVSRFSNACEPVPYSSYSTGPSAVHLLVYSSSVSCRIPSVCSVIPSCHPLVSDIFALVVMSYWSC